MKVSYNWLREYLDITMPAEAVGDVLTAIGLEVEGIERYESLKGGLEKLVVGEVLTCEKHPDATKLSVTTVQVAADAAPLQIICGAPNVAAGQKVIVATIGAVLHPTEGEPFEIKKSRIRGVDSFGMICAEDEIGIGNDHAGIMVLPPTVAVGTAAADYFRVERDWVLEVGLTPNRSDATGHLGVAQDLAAGLQINHAYAAGVKNPELADLETQTPTLPITVSVENEAACPRYSGIVVTGLTIAPSPAWLTNRLQAIGVRPINNVVDITNFVLHEYGQPLHAFDYEALGENPTLRICQLPTKTPFVALDETTRHLHQDDLMICDGNARPLCIGGVFGGLDSGVKASTTTIFLESAHFNPASIRRTSTRHDLRTDAARVFEKGSDPNLTVTALQRAVWLLQKLAGGRVASGLIDHYPRPVLPRLVAVRVPYIRQLIGANLSEATIRRILEALRIEIRQMNADQLTVAVPTNKHDVTREADIIEEILRIYGLNKIEIPTQVKSALSFTKATPSSWEIRNTLSDLLTANGFFEMMATSITDSRYFKTAFPVADEALVFINNTANMNLDVMRPTMVFSGLEAIVHNQNRQSADLKLYEYGKTYHRKGADEFEEIPHFAVFMTGMQQGESWLNTAKKPLTYYDLKAQVHNLLHRVGITDFQAKEIENSSLWAFGMDYFKGTTALVSFGRLHGQLTKAMDVKQEVFYADFRMEAIVKFAQQAKVSFQKLPKFQAVRRDLALVVDASVRFSQLQEAVRKPLKGILQDLNLFDVYEHPEHIGIGKKSYAVSFILLDAEKQLQDKEIEKAMAKAVQVLEQQLGAVVRK